MHSLLLTAATVLCGVSIAAAAPVDTTDVSIFVSRDLQDLQNRGYLIPNLIYPAGYSKASCPLGYNVLGGSFQTRKRSEESVAAPSAGDLALAASTSQALARRSGTIEKRQRCQIIGEVLFHRTPARVHNTETFNVLPFRRYVFTLAADVVVQTVITWVKHGSQWVNTNTAHFTHKGATVVFDAVANTQVHYQVTFASTLASGSAALFQEWA